MTKLASQNQASGQATLAQNAAAPKAGQGDYTVGYCKPPLHTRWQPGQSGNPNGRPKKRHDLKAELKKIAAKTMTVRDGETAHQVSMAAANVLAHGVKGAKGDVRSAGLFLSITQKMGLLEDDETAVINELAHSGRTAGEIVASAPAPSEILFANLELNLLTRQDIVELSRLAQVIDMGGDFTALSTADFERVKYIVNKGRGKDVTAQ